MAELEREEITKRIKQARKEAGLTQPELAALLDVVPRTYQNYEADRVPWDLIERIAKATGKTSQWLLHGSTPDLMGTANNDHGQLERIEIAVKDNAKLLRRLHKRLDAQDALLEGLRAIERAAAPAAPAVAEPSKPAQDADARDLTG